MSFIFKNIFNSDENVRIFSVYPSLIHRGIMGKKLKHSTIYCISMELFSKFRGMFEHVERKKWNTLAPLKLHVSFLRKKI